MSYTQEPPFCVQVEMAEGCNLRCQFCGLNGIRGRQNDFKFMTTDLARRITWLLKEARWRPRIEFAMHGEPSANPDFLAILGLFRRHLGPSYHLMMTSNGYGFVKDPTATVDEALRWLNVLALDWYENVLLVPKVLDGYRGAHQPRYYPADREVNPHQRRQPGQHDLVIVQDIEVATSGTHATINNHAGCGAPKNNLAAGKRCAKPFRELSVRWDGTVAVCCNDWRGEYRCGDLCTQTLEEIWQGEPMQAARRRLYQGRRDFGPCAGCDALSYRPGLLPDKHGRQTVPEPTPADEATIAAALGQGPLTLPVLRSWELQTRQPGGG